MRRHTLIILSLVGIILCLAQCKKDDSSNEECPPVISGKFNFSQFPLANLSDYGFFIGDMKDQVVTDDILPYDVITPLFSDYAHKKRFLWMPEDSISTYNQDGEILDMPDHTIIIKSFYYDNVQPGNTTRIVETRLLYKIAGEWNFADYVWNDAQTEAVFDLDGSTIDIAFINDFGEQLDVNYRIPSEAECLTCHKITDNALPIGPKPQNLNKNYSYSSGEMNQLQKWIEVGFLNPEMPAMIETVVDWTDEALPKLDRVRAYLDMNCAHCHREGSHCSYRPMRFAWNETDDFENIGLCVEPAEPIDPNQLFVVAPGNANKSMLYYRIDNENPAERMPLMGRTINHQEGIDLIRDWINELEINCD
ncbi:MAG: hypothetical protein AB8B53_01785 [Flavobacteriales bacterium]